MKTILEALRDTEKQYRIILTKLAKNHGITIAEWHLLQQVANGVDTQDKLAKEMALDNSTMSRQLSSLYKKELVFNTAVGRDRRQLVYEMTEKGQQVLSSVEAQHTRYEDTVFAIWSAEEKSMIQILLNRLEKSLSKQL